jgi:TfoX/Sxy family transcriptional regulator of competence genes
MAYDRGLAERVRVILQPRSGFSERQMFGGICFMINGNMCCGVVKTDLMLRLSPEAAAHALKQPHVRSMDFTGKPMKSMIYVDAHGADADEALHEWVEAAYSFAASLKAK